MSALLAPSIASQGWRHRWRLMWTWRALRRLAVESGIRVLLLSNTVGGRTVNGGLQARSQLALGQLWTTAVSTRLELSSTQVSHATSDVHTSGASADFQKLTLSLRKSARSPTGASCAM